MKNFEVGHLWSLFQLVTLRADKDMLHTKYQSCRPSSFGKEEFENWLLCSKIPTCDYWGRASFDPGGHHMNKLDRGLQGDAIYKI